MPKGYIVFVGSFRPFVCPSFNLSVRPSVIPSVNTCYNQVLLWSFFIMYISAATYQKLFIFIIAVPGKIFFHSTSLDSWAMTRDGARGQNQGCLNKVVYCYNQVLLWSYLITYISAATYQKLFIFGIGVPGRVLFHSTSKDPWVMPQSRTSQ